ncbi:MAG: aminotransferase class III-fold pyridoxal phosphate-dependent enzyme [Colwellia sp.]|nr:aminotransferase class III-fold pyridoxal phosphate-dependent enzyme [Colwellia sp.]
MGNNRYTNSEDLLARALKTIPLGAQTFSKSKTQFPLGASPYFAKRSKGANIWDVDGNEYVDYMSALLSITLGYCDPDVTNAVRDQLDKGTIFSLGSELEIKVAEEICEMVPCAEMVRFGKNGSDATAGAIRIARAYTKQEKVAVCGYHGWQDWYIGSTSRNLGVPQSTIDLTLSFEYNNIESLARLFRVHKGEIAAVILEPMNVHLPEDNFLEKVKELTHHNNAVLVFDETITGFRFSNGGAQEMLGVTPDLATFGKGLANGYPLSAVAGKQEIMRLMEDVFFSFTFGGEALSLAASLATLKKIKEESVIDRLYQTGEYLSSKLKSLILDNGLDEGYEVLGLPVWSFFVIKEHPEFSQWELKTLLIQEMFANDIINLGSHNITYAHTREHVDKLMRAYSSFFDKVKAASEAGDISEVLTCEPLKPLFKVR